MSDRLLVAYATKYGATAEIAEKIGAVLHEEGFHVDVMEAAEVRDVVPYVAVVVGSAVYAGSWRKEAAELLTQHAGELAERPVWLSPAGPPARMILPRLWMAGTFRTTCGHWWSASIPATSPSSTARSTPAS